MKFILLISLLMACKPLFGIEWNSFQIEESGAYVGDISENVSRKIESKYHLKCCGAGIAAYGGPIELICLSFTSNEILSVSQLRRLLLACAQEMAIAVNATPNMQQYLLDPPFTIKNAEILIYIHDAYGKRVRAPNVGSACIVDGKLNYRYKDSEKRACSCFKVIEETYEEALEAIRQEDAMRDR